MSRRAWPALVVGLALLGCLSAPQTRALRSDADAGLPRSARVPDVPLLVQRTNECGPAALATVLRASGVDVALDPLVDQVYLPGRGGTLQATLVAAARGHGRVAVEVRGLRGVLAEVAAGRPVLVLEEPGLGGYRAWHYAVVVAYDLDAGTITLHSGEPEPRRADLRVFERSWSRAEGWALLTLPPDRLPVNADERAWLEAVSGLERARRPHEAAIGYQTATHRWPRSSAAWLGLGNARYASDDLAGAERAFERASRIDPDSGPAFNNLAQVRLERGDRAGARAAIGRALAIGGPLLPTYQSTDRNIGDGP